MIEEMNLFEISDHKPRYKIPKGMQIRMIECFAGIGSQIQSLKNIGANIENNQAYRMIEFDPKVVKTYNKIHGTDFVPTDIRNVKGGDLGITDTDKYCYILTYSFP